MHVTVLYATFIYSTAMFATVYETCIAATVMSANCMCDKCVTEHRHRCHFGNINMSFKCLYKGARSGYDMYGLVDRVCCTPTVWSDAPVIDH